jgi:hypothetical protein
MNRIGNVPPEPCAPFRSRLFAVARPFGVIVILAGFLLCLPALAWAQRADVVTLANGDRITGEIVRLDRGRLEFKTDDAGTLYLEWENLATLVTKRQIEVETHEGVRYFGSLAPAPSRALTVMRPEGDVALSMANVTFITPIGRSFLRKLDGSIDAGFNYTQSSGIGTLTLNSNTVHRQPYSQARVAASVTLTQTKDDSERDDRATLDLSYLRYPWKRWFLLGVGRFETNESLGLVLRSQAAMAVGPRLVNSNRGQMAVGAGLAFNDEHGVDVGATQNIEAMFLFQTSYFTYDRPSTNLDIGVQYYPSLSSRGRHRFQLDTSVRRELVKDLFVSLNLYNSYDNRPPNPSAERNDLGVVASIGWTY